MNETLKDGLKLLAADERCLLGYSLEAVRDAINLVYQLYEMQKCNYFHRMRHVCSFDDIHFVFEKLHQAESRLQRLFTEEDMRDLIEGIDSEDVKNEI